MPITIGSLEVNSRVYVPPMAGVTDMVFRAIVREIDKDCLLSTEMVSSRGLFCRKENRIMDIGENEHPIGIQLFGHEPDVMARAACLAEERGADFVDINMGCPVPKIVKGGDGCSLMREPQLASQIVKAVRAAIKIPLTVKFRLGWDAGSRNCVEFARLVEEAGASLVTVHGRTRQEMYAGKADWSYIARVKAALAIPVFGNGDVFEVEDARALLDATGCDGVAVARGSLGNPWLIPRITKYLDQGILDEPPALCDRLVTAFKHFLGLVRYKGLRVGTSESRRHLCYYTKRIAGGAVFRSRLTQITGVEEVAAILADLADHAGGAAGKELFLNKIENAYLEYGIQPGKRDAERQDGVHSPVDLAAVQPFANP
jgi:tRNA-dihydrouridine synthase B